MFVCVLKTFFGVCFANTKKILVFFFGGGGGIVIKCGLHKLKEFVLQLRLL